MKMTKQMKRMLYSASVLGVLAGGVGIAYQINPTAVMEVAYALTLPDGAKQVGTINNAPVIKSPTDNMASDTFQEIIAGILEGADNPPYIINQASWGNDTSLFNGQPLSSISSSATAIFGADGFLPTDHAVEMAVGSTAYINNVGTAIEVETGKEIPISLAVTVNSATEPEGTPLTSVVMGAKSQSSVITLAWGSIVRGGTNTGGGQTEGGGIGGGESQDGTLLSYIHSISYTLTFVNTETGQPLPNETLMPIKNSDIDAYQLATMDGKGAKGYVLSPDTALTQDGNGFKSTSNGAINEDSTDLTENSYVVIKQYNSNLVQYEYTDGANDHLDIVTGHFGETPFKISELMGGKIKIDKTTLGYGKNAWNDNYSFEGLLFDVIDSTGRVRDTIKLDKNGVGESKLVPKGEYTIKERSSNWLVTGQTVHPDMTATVKTNEVTTIKPENKAVVGENTLQKVDKETGTEKNGNAELQTAKYQLVYNDVSTGSSPHKVGDPVKWTDKPAPKLLLGEKVTSAVIGGKEVDFGEAVVIDVDDEKLQASIGNLALGKYKWVELDAGKGYVTDPVEHEFEIKQKDEKTETVIADEQKSEEKIIEALITINKMVTLPDSQGGSGFNDIEFTATPINGTQAEPVKMVTGVNPTTGDDGFASGSLVYGDWKLEETKGVEGYEDIKPIYIHMETDDKKDVLTISASYYEDFSKPFSKRSFALQDSSKDKNPNSAGTVGSVSSDKPTISLSTLHFNDNPEIPTPPTPPTKDVTKTDGGESINEGDVALASDFVYELNASTLQANREDTTTWTILDDYDENFDRYNGTFKLYTTSDFDEYKVGDELPNEWVKSKDKDGKVLFSVQQAFLDVVNAHKDKAVGFTIHADFYRFKDSDNVVNTFVETINDVKTDSNEVNTKTPAPQPHKFDLSEEKVDLKGDKLLDDDSEMDDRYKDSNNDPYADKKENNEKENINTDEVKVGQTLYYQLWLDTTPFDETSELTALRMVDIYDSSALTVDTSVVKVYNAKGEDVTKQFKVEDKDGTLTISANVFTKAKNSKGEEVSIVDTEKLPLGQIYKIEAPMTVKEGVEAGKDIINTARQEWVDSEGIESNHETEKRVNKVVEGKVEPKTETPKTIGSLPYTGEEMMRGAVLLGTMILAGVGAYVYFGKKKKVSAEEPEKSEKTEDDLEIK